MAGLTNNPIELLIALNVNDKTSKANIDNYIKDLKLQLKDLDIINLTVKGDSSNNKVFSDMEKQIKSLQGQIQDLSNELSSIGKKVKIGDINISEDIRSNLKLSERHIRDFLQNKGLKDFDLTLNAEVNTTTGEQELKRFTATVKNEFGEIEKLNFKLNNAGMFTQVSESLKNIDTALLNNYNKAFENLNTRIIEIGRTGEISSVTIDKFKKELHEIGEDASPLSQKVNRLQDALSELNKQFKMESHMNKMKDSMEEAGRSVENLYSKLERMRNTYKRQFSNIEFSSEANEIRNAIGSLPKANFADSREVKQYNNEIAKLETRITSLNSKVVSASRSSMTVLNSFKTALEKFPINNSGRGKTL